MLALRVIARRRCTPSLIRTNTTLSANNTPSNSAPPPLPPADTSVNKSKSASGPTPASTSSGKTQVASTGAPVSAKSEKEHGDDVTRGRKRRRVIKRRPPISLTNPRKWNPPVKPGTLPVYDEALKVIKEDSISLKKELKAVQARISEIEKELLGASSEAKEGLEKELKELKEKVDILEVQSEINLPWIRWYAANGMGMLTRFIFSSAIPANKQL